MWFGVSENFGVITVYHKWVHRRHKPMSAFLMAGVSLTPSPVTATTLPWRWHASTISSFWWGIVRAKTMSWWFRMTSSSCMNVMSAKSAPCTTIADASLNRQEEPWITNQAKQELHNDIKSWGLLSFPPNHQLIALLVSNTDSSVNCLHLLTLLRMIQSHQSTQIGVLHAIWCDMDVPVAVTVLLVNY